ncbi:MAG: sterol desaturase family protein [Chitinophagales bacterium]
MKNKLFTSTQKQAPPAFDNAFMESMTRTPPYLPFVIFIPVILFFLYRAIFITATPLWQIALLWFSAMVFWTALEYFIHRYLLHFKTDSEFGKKMMYSLHGIHHDYPNDTSKLFLPLWVTIPGGFGFYFLFLWLIGPELIDAFFSGLVASYLFYDFNHYAVHHLNLKNPVFQFLKKHHLSHHFKDPSRAFGFTTSVWDNVFGTPRKK